MRFSPPPPPAPRPLYFWAGRLAGRFTDSLPHRAHAAPDRCRRRYRQPGARFLAAAASEPTTAAVVGGGLLGTENAPSWPIRLARKTADWPVARRPRFALAPRLPFAAVPPARAPVCLLARLVFWPPWLT